MKRGKILIVDDNEDILFTFENATASFGRKYHYDN